MLKNWFMRLCEERDEALMKQTYGDKPGEYRPKTLEEIKLEHPNESEEVIGYLYEFELECWGLKEPDLIKV
ncbi:MAG TPA: hypothetical protein VI911_00730 [Patescibacteria group bacterium]|nr:hypothetical protein [Patescibacteria group bacterium]